MNNSYQKWLAGEGCCGAQNFIHIEIPDCDKHDVCDCENILLEISKLHTDDEILQEEIDELSGKVETISGEVENKLDISAYTPVDLTDYATKQWVEDKGYLTTHQTLKTINGESLIGEGNIVISGGSGATIDAYTKAESDNRFQPKGNYLTSHQPIKTINNQSLIGTGNITISGDTDLSNYYTKAEVNYLIPTVPTNVSAFNNDAGYLTQHQPLKTINGQTISGTGNIVISGDTDLSNYYNKTEVDNIITSAITDVEAEIPSLSGYATEQWVLDKNYITSADTVFNNYATTANTYTKTEVNNLLSNKIWCGTQSQYDALATKENDVLYLIHE